MKNGPLGLERFRKNKAWLPHPQPVFLPTHSHKLLVFFVKFGGLTSDLCATFPPKYKNISILDDTINLGPKSNFSALHGTLFGRLKFSIKDSINLQLLPIVSV